MAEKLLSKLASPALRKKMEHKGEAEGRPPKALFEGEQGEEVKEAPGLAGGLDVEEASGWTGGERLVS